MTANSVIEDARVARVRELKTALAEAKERLARVEEERDSLLAHFDLALVALHDFEQLGEGAQLQIVDGWNAILRHRNVSKLTSEEISQLKADYHHSHYCIYLPHGNDNLPQPAKPALKLHSSASRHR